MAGEPSSHEAVTVSIPLTDEVQLLVLLLCIFLPVELCQIVTEGATVYHSLQYHETLR